MPENTEPEDIHEELPEGGEQTSPIDQRKLADEAAKRRKELPLLQRIVKHFSKDRAVYRELVINAETLEKRVALLTNGVLDKFEIEHKGENRMVGAIFKGRVQNLEGGLKAAFVDIGQPKNAFLHYWDMLPAANDSQVEFIRDNESAEQKQRKARYQAKDIPQLFPAGSDIVIQVVKDQIGTKGPRSTTNIALPGRYLVLMPFSGACGVSRKIEESSERERLKDILRSLTIPEGMGVIIRTAGEGKQARWFVRDLHMLLKRWQAIVEKINAPDRKPVLLYQEPGLIERTVRDFLTEDVERIVVDSAKANARILRPTAVDVSKVTTYSWMPVGVIAVNPNDPRVLDGTWYQGMITVDERCPVYQAGALTMWITTLVPVGLPAVHPLVWAAINSGDADGDQVCDAVDVCPNQPEVACEDEQVFVTGDMARVICVEAVSGVRLIATNLFLRSGAQWRMIHHQASLLTAPMAAQGFQNLN